MPVDTLHIEYSHHFPIWQRIRDCIDGEDSVKRRGVDYLPKLGGQTDDQYDAYRNRAMFYGATGRTRDGLLGAIFRKDPEIVLPGKMESKRSNIDLAGTSLIAFSRLLTMEVLGVGRSGLLTDVPVSGGSSYITMYHTEQITNWRTRVVDSVTILDQVILKETENYPAEDGFGSRTRTRYRVLEIDEDGFYRQRLFTQSVQGGPFTESEVIPPLVRGQRLKHIPFTFVGPMSLAPEVQQPVLLALANVNISHYRTSADLEHGCHWTALPTPWVRGIAEDTGPLHIGSQTAWMLGGESATCGMLEFTGAGLNSLEKRLEAKEGLMVQLGARLLEDQKKAAETAESKRLQYSGENSILATVANTVTAALQQNLTWAAQWDSVLETGDGISCKLNTDFFDAKMDPQEIAALVAAWQAGGMSKRTMIYNFDRGEMLPPDVTVDDEIAQIDTEGPALGTLGVAGTPPDATVVGGTGAA